MINVMSIIYPKLKNKNKAKQSSLGLERTPPAQKCMDGSLSRLSYAVYSKKVLMFLFTRDIVA